MKNSLSLVLVTICCFFAANSQATVCQDGAKVRKIEVVYPNGTELPCEVLYTKEDENQVLWSAKHDVSFCVTNAAQLVEKHQSWGWQCSEDVVNQTEQPEETPAADADLLSEEESRLIDEKIKAEEVNK